MNKWGLFSFVLSLVLIGFSSCGTTITSDEQPYFQFLNETTVPINVQYIRVEYFGHLKDSAPTHVIVIPSKNELEYYYKNYRMRIWDETGNLIPDKDFLNAIEKYSENYFLNNFLVIVGITENSGSIRHKLIRIYENGDILIKRLLPEMGADDMASWSIVVELGNNHKNKQYRLLPLLNENMR